MLKFNWIDSFRNVIDFVEMIRFIEGVAVAIVAERLIKWRKKHQLKQVLSLQRNSKEYFVSIPKFKSVILKRERDIAIWDEISLMFHINSFLSKIGIAMITSSDTSSNLCNEIQIGGPVSNEFTNRYFKQYLKGIRWIVTKAHLNRYKDDPNLKLLNYDFIDISVDGKQGFQIGDEFYEYIPQKRGWAIIIKLIDKSSVSQKTIHLLFGCGINGTIGAVSYFINCYSDIYKKHKSHPYIGVFEVDGQGNKVGNISYLSDLQKYLKV